MSDLQKLAEELIDHLHEILQPAPKPRRATKLALSVGGFIMAAAVGAVVWESRKAPGIPYGNQAE
jgi:hypothetical protein